MQLLKVCDLETEVVVGEGMLFSDGQVSFKLFGTDSVVVYSGRRVIRGWNLLPVGDEHCVTEEVSPRGD